MLSPSRLFFGTPDDPADSEPDADEKPALGSVLDLLKDSDAEEQTDVPGEHSLEASLNESDEDRKSPAGEHRLRSPSAMQLGAFVAAAGQAAASAAPGGSSDRPPPGLPLLSTAPPQSPAGELASGLGVGLEELDCEGSRVQPQYSELPSIGSANHFNGTCDRCCFHPKGRCLNGFNCQHCHYDHEKRKRKGKKKGKMDGFKPMDGEDGEGEFLAEAEAAASMGEVSVPVSLDGALLAAHRTPVGSMPMSPESSVVGHRAPLAASMPTTPDGSALSVRQPMGMTGLGEIAPTPSPGLEFLGPPLEINSGGLDVPGLGGAALRPPPPPLVATPEPQLFAREQHSGGQPDMSLPPEIMAYVSQLEAENRYLKACITQCSGQAAGGAGLGLPSPPMPHQESPCEGSLQMQSLLMQQRSPSHLPPQSPMQQPPGPHLPQTPPPFPRPQQLVAEGLPLTTRPPMTHACGGDLTAVWPRAAAWDFSSNVAQPAHNAGLSADAVPFWPSQSQAPW